MADQYEFHIKGHLDRNWGDWFSGFTFAYHPDGTTVLRGEVSDQPALLGLLMRINQLGLELLRVEQINKEDQGNE